jgi:hypothetical protein
MGDISHGPTSGMPGSSHELPPGAMCDEHPRRKAFARIQGETDSFGCEYLDLCKQCLKELRDYNLSEESKTGRCDWCKKDVNDLRHKRDFEEGLGGPVYRVCRACAEHYDAEMAEDDDYDWY